MPVYLHFLGQERRLRRVTTVEHASLIEGSELHGGVNGGGGGASHDDGHMHVLTLKQLAEVLHLLERGRYQAAHTHQQGLLTLHGGQYRLGRNHHSEVNNVEVITSQHNSHNVLAYVMHVAFHRCHDHLGLFGQRALLVMLFYLRLKNVYSQLHYLGRLHHLWQEHLALAKHLTHFLHARHKGPLDNLHGVAVRLGQCFGDILTQIVAYTLGQSMRQALFYGLAAPVVGLHGLLFARCLSLYLLGQVNELFGGTRRFVKYYVLHGPQQVGFYVVIHLQHAWINDAHVKSLGYGMIEKHRVHGLTHHVIASESEREIGYTAAGQSSRKIVLNPPHGLDEVDAIVGMFLYTRAHGEHVHVEDDVVRAEMQPIHQQVIGPLAYSRFAFIGSSLSVFIESHHHDGRPHELTFMRMSQKLGFSVLQTDAVDDAFALCIAQAFKHCRPVG